MKRRHLGSNPLHGAFRPEGILELFNIKKENPPTPTETKEEKENPPEPPLSKGGEGGIRSPADYQKFKPFYKVLSGHQ